MVTVTWWNRWAAGWLSWWENLTGFQKSWPALLVASFWSIFLTFHNFNNTHIQLGAAILLLGYLGRTARAILNFFFPLILTAIIYDSQRIYSDAIRGTIRVAEPYYFDKRFFGIPTENGRLTPNEWWQLHTHPSLDFITGIFYIFFIPFFLMFAGFYHFIKPRNALCVMWAFFWTNMLGYSTYYWYPAAPPWYVALYGLGPARLDVAANPAGCIRFDEIVGLPVFAEWYGHSADVFGAIPSLHVAYPLLAVYYAFKFQSGRILAVLFFLGVSFSAVYLNHHYILDILWGSAYAVAVAVAIDGWSAYRASATSEKT